MANFLEGLWGLAKHPVDEAKWMLQETKNVGKPLLKGDLGESFDQFKGTFGRHQDMMSENITVPLGGRNKLTENSDAVAGAIIGGILAAPMMAGGSAAGGAGGSGGAGMSGGALNAAGWQGGAQMGLGSTYAPTTAFGGAGGGTGAMGMGTAYTPTTAFGGAGFSGGATAAEAAPAAAGGFDWGRFAQMAQNLKSPEQPQQGTGIGSARSGGSWSGFNSKLYQNPALEQEYMNMYMQPTYTKLV